MNVWPLKTKARKLKLTSRKPGNKLTLNVILHFKLKKEMKGDE
jgi:hypothetical protein